MSAIPIPDAAPTIALPDDEEQLRRALAIPAPTPHPLATSNRGIPVDLGGKPIPVNRATGQPEEINNAGKAIAPGIAGLWTRAENIHNPILRTLGKIGAVGAKAIDVAGSVAAPGVMAQIPGTALHQALGENRTERERTEDTANAEKQARTAEEQETTREMPGASASKTRLEGAQADALENKKPKPEDLNQRYADAVSDAVKRGVNPLEDPTVQKYADSITQIQKQPASTQETLDKQYNDAIAAGDHEKAQRILKVESDLAKAKQAPQRPPQITMVVPGANGTQSLETLHPGQQVPTGAVTATQFGPEQAKQQQANASTSGAIRAFTRYQDSFHKNSGKLTDDDRQAMEVLSSHQENIARGLLESSQAGILDTLLGEPLTGYSGKLMSGTMTKEQYDKLSPAGKQMLADYFHAILANFINMKQRMGTAGSRNQAMIQAEMNAIPLPYIDANSADAMFNDTLEDIRNANPGAGGGQTNGRRVIDLTK